ncbi:hypothetical protein FNH22_06180 [Fulvivirga sp. M361]|uniref:hypothetical protein n=1 Tax=Fulvivirga sp. M361 TaxID=2594266 RepID=UPI0011799637|nr:hypothetical protein [Fulvivirga sp. M361]TRX60630.1 hypothetical protein FNH22_06180 [Fulvivirga sp. M361]
MNRLFSKMVDKFHRIDQLIRMKATGQPNELARKLSVSPSTVYEYMDVMKNVLAAPVRYCKVRRSYVYDKNGKLHLGFKNEQWTAKQ